MLNKAMLIGNVGKDPEIRRSQSGDRIATMRLATSETWKDRNSGERKERTEWHTVVCFNDGLAGVIEDWVKKGSKIYIEGQLQTRKWTDQSGAEKYTTEVVLQRFRGELTMLDGKGEGGGGGMGGGDDYGGGGGGGYGGGSGGGGGYGGGSSGGGGGGGRGGDLDDDIPF